MEGREEPNKRYLARSKATYHYGFIAYIYLLSSNLPAITGEGETIFRP
jgi:hypothetical protein